MSILEKCYIKEEEIFPASLGGKTSIRLRQLSAGEGIEYQSILKDKEKTLDDAVHYAVSCVMVEPKFFTSDELAKINSTGKNLIDEIHAQIMTIGLSEQEKKAHEKKVLEYLKNRQNNLPPDTKEETEGK